MWGVSDATANIVVNEERKENHHFVIIRLEFGGSEPKRSVCGCASQRKSAGQKRRRLAQKVARDREKEREIVR